SGPAVASSRFLAIALRGRDYCAIPFEPLGTDKTYATLRIAIAHTNAPVRASQLQISNLENHLPGIFSTAFVLQRETPAMHGDMPLTCETKRFARLQDSAKILRSEHLDS